MKRDVFLKRRAEFLRRDARAIRVQVAAGLCGLALFYGLAHFFPEANNAIAIAFIACALAVLAWALRIPNQAEERGLVCHACGGGLLNAPGDYAVAVG